METLRSVCEDEIRIQRQRVDSFVASFRKSPESIVERAQATVQGHAKLAEIKAELREAEDELVKVLAVKTRKEAREMAIRDSVSATKARIEEVKRALQIQRSKKDEQARIISQQSSVLAASEVTASQGIKQKADTQEAISWYNRILGFHVEGGRGVKFTFTNIDPKKPEMEHSFTVRFADDNYSLLDCDPHLDDIKELVQELNNTNDLFRFVRQMRGEFQKAALHGLPPQSANQPQESSVISVSAPVSFVSTNRSESSPEGSEPIVLCEVNQQHKKANHARRSKSPSLSSGSASSVRRSSRFKGKKGRGGGEMFL